MIGRINIRLSSSRTGFDAYSEESESRPSFISAYKATGGCQNPFAGEVKTSPPTIRRRLDGDEAIKVVFYENADGL